MIPYKELDEFNIEIGQTRRSWAVDIDTSRYRQQDIEQERKVMRDTYKHNVKQSVNKEISYVMSWNEMFDEFEKMRKVISPTPCRIPTYINTYRLCKTIETGYLPLNARGKWDTIQISIDQCFDKKESHVIYLYSKECDGLLFMRRNRPFEVYTVNGTNPPILCTQKEREDFVVHLRKNLRIISECTKEHIKNQLDYDKEQLQDMMEAHAQQYHLAM